MYSLADIIKITGAALSGSTDQSTKKEALLALKVDGVNTLDCAKPSNISFLVKPAYAKDLPQTSAAAVLLTKKYAQQCPTVALIVKDPYLAYAKVSQLFEKHSSSTGISSQAYIDPSAKISQDVTIQAGSVIGANARIGKGCYIGANTVIEAGATLGDKCVIAPSVTIHHDCELGSGVRIHSGACIGAEGFGFAPQVTKSGLDWERIAQLGRVVIGDNARIGANTCIDRGALGDTMIGRGVIIDNLVQIAHNVTIGEQTAIAACAGIAGSTQIGARCIVAGGVGIAGHLTITDDVQITGMSLVTKSINKAGSYSSGTTSMPSSEWRKAVIGFKQLAKHPKFDPNDLQTQINDLKNQLNALKSLIDNNNLDN